MTDADNDAAASFLREWSTGSGTKRQRERMLRRASVPTLQSAALHHPDAAVRHGLLNLLDHYANDASMDTFAAALHDPDPAVRNVALHSIACESCKEQEMCAADVVPELIYVLHNDPSPELRNKTLLQLMWLSDRDDRIVPAVEQSATRDPDPAIRKAAEDLLLGRYVRPKKQYERSQRRHAGTRARH